MIRNITYKSSSIHSVYYFFSKKSQIMRITLIFCPNNLFMMVIYVDLGIFKQYNNIIRFNYSYFYRSYNIQYMQRNSDCSQTIWNKLPQNLNNINDKRTYNKSFDPVNMQTFPLESIQHRPNVSVSSSPSSLFNSQKFTDPKEGWDMNDENVIQEGYTPIKLKDITNGVSLNNLGLSEVVKYLPIQFMMSLFSPFKLVHDLEMTFAAEISNLFTAGANLEDRTIIYDQINHITIIFVSFFVVYNWYFVQFYRHNTLRIKTPDISISALNSTSWIAGALFKYNIVPASILDTVMLDYIPNGMVEVFNKKITMMVMFRISVLTLGVLGPIVYKSLINSTKFKIDGISFVYIAIMTVYAAYLNIFSDIEDVGNKTLEAQVREKAAEAVAISKINPLLYISHCSITLILFILRVGWSALMVSVCSITVSLYLISISLFSMIFLSKETANFFRTMEDINYFIEREDIEENTCIPICGGGIISTIHNFICTKSKNFVLYNYKFMIEIAVIMSLLYGIYNYSSINNSDLKMGVSAINIIMIIMIVVVIIARLLTKNDNSGKELRLRTGIVTGINDIINNLNGKNFNVSSRNNFDEFITPTCDSCAIFSNNDKSLLEKISTFFVFKKHRVLTPDMLIDIRDKAETSMNKISGSIPNSSSLLTETTQLTNNLSTSAMTTLLGPK